MNERRWRCLVRSHWRGFGAALLVLDAPVLEIRRNRAGGIAALDVVDGATIKLLVDDSGRRPPAASAGAGL